MKLPRANSVSSEVALAKSSTSIFICCFPIPFALILPANFPRSFRCLQKKSSNKWGFVFPGDLQPCGPFRTLFPASLHHGENAQSVSEPSSELLTELTLPGEATSRAEGTEENHKEMRPCRNV